MKVINAWVNVLIAALIMVATLPGRTQGLGLITEPLLRDLNVDRVSYAHINLWATLLGAVVCLPAGRIFDRLGLRITTTIITALLSLVVWQMSSLAGGIAIPFFPGLRYSSSRSERAFNFEHHGRGESLRSKRRFCHGRLFSAPEHVLSL